MLSNSLTAELVLLSPKQDSIKEWLDGLLGGKVRTAPLQALPGWPLVAGPAGGAAAEEEVPVEEEFDLADIMKARSCCVFCVWFRHVWLRRCVCCAGAAGAAQQVKGLPSQTAPPPPCTLQEEIEGDLSRKGTAAKAAEPARDEL